MILDTVMGEEGGIETLTEKVIGIEKETRMRGSGIRTLIDTSLAVDLAAVMEKREKAEASGGLMGIGREIGREIGKGVGVKGPGRGDMSRLLSSQVF